MKKILLKIVLILVVSVNISAATKVNCWDSIMEDFRSKGAILTDYNSFQQIDVSLEEDVSYILNDSFGDSLLSEDRVAIKKWLNKYRANKTEKYSITDSVKVQARKKNDIIVVQSFTLPIEFREGKYAFFLRRHMHHQFDKQKNCREVLVFDDIYVAKRKRNGKWKYRSLGHPPKIEDCAQGKILGKRM